MEKYLNGHQVETNVKGFEMTNTDKLNRVIFGDMGRGGVLVGGLGVEKAQEDPELVLARYDRIAGRITKDGIKIKRGSFWDFVLKKPRQKITKKVITKASKDKPEVTKDVVEYTPEVMYIFPIGGEFVEVDDPKNLAAAITVVEKAKADKEAKFKAKKAKSKFKEVK